MKHPLGYEIPSLQFHETITFTLTPNSKLLDPSLSPVTHKEKAQLLLKGDNGVKWLEGVGGGASAEQLSRI